MHDDGLTPWAVRTIDAGQPSAPPEPPPAPRRRRALVVAVVALAVVGGGGGAVALSTGGDDADAAPAVSTPPPTTAVATTVARSTTTTRVRRPTTTTTTAPSTTTTTAPPPTTEAPVVPADPNNPVRWAVFRGGKVHLAGSIPTRELADEIIAKAGAVVGPDNVVDEYVIDPAVPRVSSAPLYVEDRVLFALGSDVVHPDFFPLLELGRVLLEQNPNVTITVVGHTDATGSPELNQALSERRVAAVIRYLTDRGVDPARLVADARGQSDPLVDTGPGVAEARNRRVEFVITGLLD